MKGIKTKAFTLIEVLLIVAIIGTLSALLVPSFTNLLEKARVNQTITDIVKISRELDDYLIDNGTLPETLVELIQDSAPLELIDPYGNPYEYLVIFGKRKQDVQGKWRKDARKLGLRPVQHGERRRLQSSFYRPRQSG